MNRSKLVILLIGVLLLMMIPLAYAEPIDTPAAGCCPELFVLADGNYASQGLLTLGSTMTATSIQLTVIPDYVNGLYHFRLTEQGNFSTIDQLSLKATIFGVNVSLPLVYATSNHGSETLNLLFVDSQTTTIFNEENIQVAFVGLPECFGANAYYVGIVGFSG